MHFKVAGGIGESGGTGASLSRFPRLAGVLALGVALAAGANGAAFAQDTCVVGLTPSFTTVTGDPAGATTADAVTGVTLNSNDLVTVSLFGLPLLSADVLGSGTTVGTTTAAFVNGLPPGVLVLSGVTPIMGGGNNCAATAVVGGPDDTAVGDNAQATGGQAVAIGANSIASGFQSTAIGESAHALGDGATAVGQNALASGTDASAFGHNSSATGDHSTALGSSSLAAGFNSTAVGDSASATGTGSTALGGDSSAAGPYATALGTNTHANGAGSVALGTDSTGRGAVANLPNQIVFGTDNHTYTAPGITSGLSKSRQSGPLEIVTTDRNGNLASDGGKVFNALSELGGGIAVAIAIQNPDLTGNETFGFAANIGFWEENVALGFAATGVVGRNVLGMGERIALSGGIGFTVDEEDYGYRNDKSSVGGRAGVQVTW